MIQDGLKKGFKTAAPGKLMRLDRGRPEIRSKSYLNPLLIDFCDSILIIKIRIDVIRRSKSTALESELTTIPFGDPNRISLAPG